MDELRNYVLKCRRYGMSDAHIRKTLKEAGHQDFMIRQAMVGRRQSSSSSGFSVGMPVIVALFAVLVLGTIGFVAMNTSGGITGASVAEVNLQDDQLLLLQAKENMLKERISEIESLDISLEEKERLIAEQRVEIDALFVQIEYERAKTLEGSVELINNILRKE